MALWGSTQRLRVVDVSSTGIRCFGLAKWKKTCRLGRPSEVAEDETSAKDHCDGIHWQVAVSELPGEATKKEGNERLFSSYGGAYCSNREPEVSKHGGKNTSVTTGQKLPFEAKKKNILVIHACRERHRPG